MTNDEEVFLEIATNFKYYALVGTYNLYKQGIISSYGDIDCYLYDSFLFDVVYFLNNRGFPYHPPAFHGNCAIIKLIKNNIDLLVPYAKSDGDKLLFNYTTVCPLKCLCHYGKEDGFFFHHYSPYDFDINPKYGESGSFNIFGLWRRNRKYGGNMPYPKAKEFLDWFPDNLSSIQQAYCISDPEIMCIKKYPENIEEPIVEIPDYVNELNHRLSR